MQDFIKNLTGINAEKIKALLKKGVSFSLSGLTNAAKLVILMQTALSGRKLLFITDTEQSALKFRNDLTVFLDKSPVLFPYQDGSIYDLNRKNLYKYAAQTDILLNRPDFAIIPSKALFEKFPLPEFFSGNEIKLKINDEINTLELAQKLVNLGYKRSTLCADAGEFSIRGDIIDVYPLSKNPVRLELWGDTITDIRYFDASSQRSIEKAEQAVIQPLYKFVLDDNSFKKISSAALEGEKALEITEQLKSREYFEGIEYFEHIFNPDLKTAPELLGREYTIVFDDYTQFKSKYEKTCADLEKQYEENIKGGLTLHLEYLKHDALPVFLNTIAGNQKIYFDNFLSDEYEINIEFNASLIPLSDIKGICALIKTKLNENYAVIAAADYKNRTKEIFKEYEIPYSENFEKGSVLITSGMALAGSIIEDYKLVFITDKELYNKRSKEISAAGYNYRRENLDFIETLNDIKEGDFIVHMIHGIGIFKGLSKQVIDGEEKDYLTLEYAHGDKLHIPAEQINMLCRYRGSGGLMPQLSRMGGKDWSSVKTKVKKSIEDTARDLINLYALRKLAKGIAFEPDTVWQYEMEEAFPYTETADQMKAITETKADMELERPMDRLICGDAGFGKTEIAIRAVFKAVMSSKQAAIAAPTTVLAMQHYKTISERFKPYPIKVELLSRFKTAKEQKDIIKKLILGEIDVVIGTHRLLQDDIQFKDLGLLVIDEEHKFGVKHKEKLKRLKNNIDILSMSATPIPRTLYMSLSGIKDMSVINTPPSNRLPIKTFVSEYKENIVKNAVNYELEREGQVFYLYNKVESIYEFASGLKQLLPNARIAIAHGQMDKNELERIMTEFLNREYDILLCTTIIESGLDIPNANTIIIHDADKFGLAQLYQIRGRVGRTDRQAYCYCLYKSGKQLTEDAVKRLKYIKEFASLGSGYQIALRDIEIRGAGNILGEKQHGQMTAVGFDTYCAMLEDAIEEIQSGKAHEEKNAIVDINVTAYIPDEWAGSKEQKMIEYKRLAGVKSVRELEIIQSEWKDRFSKMPECTENLIKLVKLRILASQAGISLVRETDSAVRIYSGLSKGEWNIIAAKNKNAAKYIKYTIAPKSCTDGISILLLNRRFLNFDETFNVLSELFYTVIQNLSRH